jgi:hypothetical protein
MGKVGAKLALPGAPVAQNGSAFLPILTLTSHSLPVADDRQPPLPRARIRVFDDAECVSHFATL